MAGEAGRTSACSVMGFSSRHTTGSWGWQGCSYVSRTSSILAMYSSLSSATHHIFFPPRLEVVTCQTDPYVFPPHPRHQPALHRFLGHQPYRPAGPAFRRFATNHGNDSLLLSVIQQFSCSGPLFLIERTVESLLLIAMADFSNRLGSQWDNSGNMRRADALGELQKRHRPHDDSHRLHAPA